MKVLLFDNYDSFTYNLLHILKELGAEVEVHRNDKISLDEVERFDKILLSPGPGIPEEAGILLPLIRRYAPTKSILGIRCNAYQPGECTSRNLFGYTGDGAGCVVYGLGTRFPCRPLPFVGRIEREFPRLPGDHGRGYGRRTDHGASPSRI